MKHELLTITRPDDWHVHLRDGAALRSVLPFTARQFSRAVVMPNLLPPVTRTEQAIAYRERIIAALPPSASFSPLMTLYLTDDTSAGEIERAHASGITACKLYPAGATTNSQSGVTRIEQLDETLAAMARAGMPLLVHGEVTRSDVDVFDREKIFIDEVLAPLASRLPELRIVFEHITTAEAATFVRNGRDGLAATITPQHLLMHRNALFDGGLRPHHYCLPVLKREHHRDALIDVIRSGNPRFFLGTDSAPHPRAAKESACGCAGIFSAHAAIELYAEAFETAGALDKLEGFASLHGPDFYRLPRNSDTITLRREPWMPPADYPLGDARIVPLRAGETIAWRLVDEPPE